MQKLYCTNFRIVGHSTDITRGGKRKFAFFYSLTIKNPRTKIDKKKIINY